MSPTPPKAGLDWSNLSFANKLTVNGHIETRYNVADGKWSTPRLVQDPKIAVHGLSPAFNYGQQCYEGLKAFRTAANEVIVFRPQANAARMAKSAASLSLPPPPENLFLECIRQVVVSNAEYVPPADSDAYLYLRPVLFGSSPKLSLTPGKETILAVYAQPFRPMHGSHAIDGTVLDHFDRAAPRGMGQYKIGGNYAPVWRHTAKAKEDGYGITLHLDSATRTLVEEFSTSGFMGLKTVDGRPTVVVPETTTAIESITCASLQRLAAREGWVVEQRPLPFSDVADFEEVIAVGTAAAAVPLRSITRTETKEKFHFDSSQGKLTKLAALMGSIQRGRANDTEGWCYNITGFPEASEKEVSWLKWAFQGLSSLLV